jgi:hypothetical protein
MSLLAGNKVTLPLYHVICMRTQRGSTQVQIYLNLYITPRTANCVTQRFKSVLESFCASEKNASILAAVLCKILNSIEYKMEIKWLY